MIKTHGRELECDQRPRPADCAPIVLWYQLMLAITHAETPQQRAQGMAWRE